MYSTLISSSLGKFWRPIETLSCVVCSSGMVVLPFEHHKALHKVFFFINSRLGREHIHSLFVPCTVVGQEHCLKLEEKLTTEYIWLGDSLLRRLRFPQGKMHLHVKALTVIRTISSSFFYFNSFFFF